MLVLWHTKTNWIEFNLRKCLQRCTRIPTNHTEVPIRDMCNACLTQKLKMSFTAKRNHRDAGFLDPYFSFYFSVGMTIWLLIRDFLSSLPVSDIANAASKCLQILCTQIKLHTHKWEGHLYVFFYRTALSDVIFLHSSHDNLLSK